MNVEIDTGKLPERKQGNFKSEWNKIRGYEEGLKENIKKIRMLVNKGVWIYILDEVGRMEREDVERIAETLKQVNEDKRRIPLSKLFKEAQLNHLPKALSRDNFFNHVCFEYDLPGKSLQKRCQEQTGNGVSACRIADILSGEWAPVIKDLYGLEARGEIKINSSYDEDGNYKETFFITGTGEETARTTKYLFNYFIKPYLTSKDLIVTNPRSNELKTMTS